MNPEQWLSLKWNGGSTMSDRWLNQSKIIQEEKQLFASRQRQLNSICAELKESQGEREPYAIAIAGKWGTGKTSFVNVLKKKIENAEFIHIECTIGHDVEAILNDCLLYTSPSPRDS